MRRSFPFPSLSSALCVLTALSTSALLSSAPLHAQNSGVQLKLDFVAWGDEIGGLTFKASEKSGSITALSFRYSQPVTYSGPALMEIRQTGVGQPASNGDLREEDKEHQAIPLAPEPAKPEAEDTDTQKQGLALELDKRRKEDPTLVALAKLPANSRRATILLAPASAGTYQTYVIDDDPSLLPIGKLRIHNLSPFTIAMRCNSQAAKELKTREAFTVPSVNQQVIYELAYQMGREWKVQENNLLPVRPDEQTQLIVLRSGNRYFLSTDGSSGGFLQTVILRRGQTQSPPVPR